MRYIKKIQFFVLLLLSVVVLTGCDLSSEDKKVVLAAPTEWTLEGDVLSWVEVPGAMDYSIVLSDITYVVQSNEVNLKTLLIEPGTYQIRIRAHSVEGESELSSMITFVIGPSEPDVDVIGLFLTMFDETYTLDMVASNFESNLEYEEYKMALRVSESVAITMGAIRDNSEIVLIANTLDSMLSDLISVENIYDLKEVVDQISTLGVSPKEVSYLLTELALTYMEFYNDNFSGIQLQYEQIQLDLLDLIETKEQSVGYIYIMDKFDTFATDDDYIIIKDMIESATYFEDDLQYQLEPIADLVYNYAGDMTFFYQSYQFENGYYDEETQVFFEALARTFSQAYVSNGQYFFDEQTKIGLSDTYELSERYHDLAVVTKELEQLLLIKNKVEAFEALMLTDQDRFVTGIGSVITYMVDVYGQVDVDLIEMLESSTTSELSLTEAIILKNEMVSVFSETLPSVEDYENTFILMSLMMEVMLDDDSASAFDDISGELATYNHYSMKLLLALALDIDETVVNEVSAIVDGLYTEGYYDGINDEYISDQYNVEKIVQLILYVDDYYNAFKLEHAADFAVLNNSQTEELRLQFNALYERVIITAISQYYPEENNMEMMAELVHIFDQMELTRAAYAIYENIGLDIYQLFIDTEGKLALDMWEMYLLLEADADPNLLGTKFQSILASMVDYNNIIIGGLSQEDIEVILEANFAYLKSGYVNEENITEAELTLWVDKMVPALAGIIYPMLQLEIELLEVLENNQAAIDYIEHSMNLTSEERVLEQVILALDVVLDEEMKLALLSSVEALFQDVLSDSLTQEMLGLETTDVDTLKVSTLADLNALFDTVEIVAAYDFDQLTPEEYSLFITIFQMFEIE